MRLADAFLRRDWLDVGQGHQLHLAQYGNPNGIPVLYLHGGPGAGCHEEELRIFNLSNYRVFLLDQRGAGLSQARNYLRNNDLQGLVADIERVRHWLECDALCLAGGSFGATLGLIYSALNPKNVLAQVYWGVFSPSDHGRDWLYGSQGAARHFADAYRQFVGVTAADGTCVDALLSDYHLGLHRGAGQQLASYVQAWLQWEQALALPKGYHALPAHVTAEDGAERLARIELHYAQQHYFEAQILLKSYLARVTAPTRVLQGEHDWVCPPQFLAQYQSLFSNPVFTYQVVNQGYHSLADISMFSAVSRAVSDMAASVAVNSNAKV